LPQPARFRPFGGQVISGIQAGGTAFPEAVKLTDTGKHVAAGQVREEDFPDGFDKPSTIAQA